MQIFLKRFWLAKSIESLFYVYKTLVLLVNRVGFLMTKLGSQFYSHHEECVKRSQKRQDNFSAINFAKLCPAQYCYGYGQLSARIRSLFIRSLSASAKFALNCFYRIWSYLVRCSFLCCRLNSQLALV